MSGSDFSVTVFNHAGLANQGERLSLSGLRGKVVVGNFWATSPFPPSKQPGISWTEGAPAQ